MNVDFKRLNYDRRSNDSRVKCDFTNKCSINLFINVVGLFEAYKKFKNVGIIMRI